MRPWSDQIVPNEDAIQNAAVVGLRAGLDMVLCDLTSGDDEPFSHAEDDDLIGFGFHLKGGAEFAFDDQAFQTRPGDCWIAASPKGARSEFTPGEAGFRTLSLRMSLTVGEPLFEAEAGLSDLLTRGRSQMAIQAGASVTRERATLIQTAFASPYEGAAQRLFLESIALSLLAWQMDAGRPASPSARSLSCREHDRMVRARDRLDETLDAPPSLAQLARDVGVNDFKLKRDFKRAFGMTVFGYVRDQRLRQAASHLTQGLSVQAAAMEVGYACPSRFSQAFRRQFGVSPSEVRRDCLTPGSHG